MPIVVTPDPVDVRLLALISEAGRAPVHAVAARLGMDVREVAARLAGLAATGLPLVVGVECDPNGIRSALASAGVYGPNQGVPSGAYATPGAASGPYGVQGTPSNAYPTPGPQPYHPAAQPPTGYPSQPPAGFGGPQPGQPYPGPPSGGFPAQPGPGGYPQTPYGQPAVSGPQQTWGPPQSAAWARGDHAPGAGFAAPQQPPAPQGPVKQGTVGSTLDAEGLEGERLSIVLLEVVDPADFLFSAAGYKLQDGERAVVVHTELTNKGAMPFAALPDMYLVLVSATGQTFTKAPVSLSSRPPHRIGISPGETNGGHTVYVLPESVQLTEIRWSPRPDDESRTIRWTIEDN